MNEKEVIAIMKDVGGIVSGHFVFTSTGPDGKRRHGEVYVNKDAINARPLKMKKLAKAIAEYFKNQSIHIVAGPAIGGAILASWVAHELSILTGKEIYAVFSEDFDGKKIFKRGFDKLILQGKKVLIVEDIFTSGRSAKETLAALLELGAEIIGIGLLWNRGGVKGKYFNLSDDKIYALVNKQYPAFNGSDCPLCVNNVKINTDLGHGQAYLDSGRTI